MGKAQPGRCSGCGRMLPASGEGQAALCQQCGVSAVSSNGEDVHRAVFKAVISGDQAVEAARRWWRSALIARAFGNPDQAIDLQPVHLPFWRLRAKVTGDVRGYRTEGENVRVDMHVHIDRYFEWTGAACVNEAVPVEFLRSVRGDTVPLDSLYLQVPAITVSAKIAMENGLSAIEREAVDFACIPRFTGSQLEFTDKDLSILYYPFWIVKCSFAGRTYDTAVDGITGAVISGRAPGNYTFRLASLAASDLISCICSAIILWMMRYSFAVVVTFLLAIFIAAVCLAITIETSAPYRFGSEITTGDAEGGYRPFYTENQGRTAAGMVGASAGLAGLLLSGWLALWPAFSGDWAFLFWGGEFIALALTLASIAMIICSLVYLHKNKKITAGDVRGGYHPLNE